MLLAELLCAVLLIEWHQIDEGRGDAHHQCTNQNDKGERLNPI